MSDPFTVPAARLPSPLGLVDAIREEVGAWRASGYPGSSDVTRRLLEHWFLDQHQVDDQPFRYFFAQREAVETIVYLHEVVRIRSSDALIGRYARAPMTGSGQPFARYVTKMATGSGKTKVMSLVIAWSYFRALDDPGCGLSPRALLIAPNLIVYERLRDDFDAGAIFRRDPVVPPELAGDFDLQVVLRDDPAPFTATGLVCLTNVQQLYERRAPVADNPVSALLGPRPPADLHRPEPILHRLAQRGPVLVVSDEAHHLNDHVTADTGEPLVALQRIARLHELGGVVAQLDFSATPRNPDGRPFPEIVSDYPLAAAIDDGIVKRPVIGELHGDVEVPSDDAAVRYRQRLDAGVTKWREHTERLAPAGRHPLLFVMAEDTAAADQIARYLDSLRDLGGAVLTIHVNLKGNRRGEIRQDDLAVARAFARTADDPDNPYRAIVSVLMLREGWDVRNVTVIVPLRAYTAQAQILPEQTLGRGLRRMTPPGSGVEERVVVIEHAAFRDLWDAELAELGVELERRDAEDVELPARVIAPEPGRAAFDIDIPRLGRALVRAPAGLTGLRVEDLPERRLALPEAGAEDAVEYTGRDLRTGEVVEQATYVLPRADDPRAVLAYYVRQVELDGRLTGQFSVLAPLVQGWVEQRAFGQPVAFQDPRVLAALARPSVQETVFDVFRQAIDAATLTEEQVHAEGTARPLSSTRPFLWSGEVARAERSVFNLQPCDSGLEVRLCGFLDSAPDVAAFAKLAPAARLSMEYRNADGRLAYYYPDFAIRLVDGTHRLLEAKGLVDLDVAGKDRRAAYWAADATTLSGSTWRFLRVDQEPFDQHVRKLRTLHDLEDLVRSVRRAEFRDRYEPGPLPSWEEQVATMERVSGRKQENGKALPDVDAAIDRFRDDLGRG